jgi:hypothetical protein
MHEWIRFIDEKPSALLVELAKTQKDLRAAGPHAIVCAPWLDA